MIDQELLKKLKENFERGASQAKIEDTQLVFEFLKQLAQENEEIQEILEDADIVVGVNVIDKDTSFWLKAKGSDIEYGTGKVDNPTFIFEAEMDKAAGVIFGDIDPTQAYMAGDLVIQGNLQDALAFNDCIVVAIEIFEDMIQDL